MYWRLTLTCYGWDWKGVERWQVAMVLYSCSVCLTIGFCPGFLNTSLSRVSSMLDGWPTILQRALFFSSFPSSSLSLSLSIYFLLRVFPFFRRVSVFLNFYLPLGFSVLFHPPFLSRIPGSFIFFANYFSPTLLISSSVYTSVHRGQKADWAVQTSNGGENEKKFPCLGIFKRTVLLRLLISVLNYEKYNILSVRLFEEATAIFDKRITFHCLNILSCIRSLVIVSLFQCWFINSN